MPLPGLIVDQTIVAPRCGTLGYAAPHSHVGNYNFLYRTGSGNFVYAVASLSVAFTGTYHYWDIVSPKRIDWSAGWWPTDPPPAANDWTVDYKGDLGESHAGGEYSMNTVALFRGASSGGGWYLNFFTTLLVPNPTSHLQNYWNDIFWQVTPSDNPRGAYTSNSHAEWATNWTGDTSTIGSVVVS